MNATLALASGMVRSWVALYTFGLPEELRSVRRWEIDSDVWEQRQLAEIAGEPPFGTAVEMMTRTLLGVISDITWRVQTGLAAPPDRSINVNESLTMRAFVLIGLLVAAVPIFLGFTAAVGLNGDWHDTTERTMSGVLWMIPGVAIAVGLLLSARRPLVGISLVVAGAIAISAMWYWIAIFTVPIGLALAAIAYLRARQTGWPSGAGTA